MVGELIHTSVPRGVRPGSRGFCTAAVTVGLPPTLVDRLEALSGYRDWLDKTAPATPRPGAFSHIHLRIGGSVEHVVSRVAPAPNDYTGRANKIAHHRIFDPATRPPGGPAWLLRQPGLYKESYDGEPALLEPPAPPAGGPAPAPCRRWEEATSDAGWAGNILERCLRGPQPIYVVYQPTLDALALVEEMHALVPPATRWRLTFSTNHPGEAPSDVTCQLRFLPQCEASLRFVKSLDASTVVRLDQLRGPAGDTEFTQAARTGRLIVVTEPERRASAPTPAAAAPDRGNRPTPGGVGAPEPLFAEYEPEPLSMHRSGRPRVSNHTPRRSLPRLGWKVLLPLSALLLTTTVLLTALATRSILKSETAAARAAPPNPPPAATPHQPPTDTGSSPVVTAPPPSPSPPPSPTTDGGLAQRPPDHEASEPPAPTPAPAPGPIAAPSVKDDPKPPAPPVEPPPPDAPKIPRLVWLDAEAQLRSGADQAPLLHPLPNEPHRVLLPASFQPNDSQVKIWFDRASASDKVVVGVEDAGGVRLGWRPKQHEKQKEWPTEWTARVSLSKGGEGRFALDLLFEPGFQAAENKWMVLCLRVGGKDVFRFQVTPSEPQPVAVALRRSGKHEYVSEAPSAEVAARIWEVVRNDLGAPMDGAWSVRPEALAPSMPPQFTLERIMHLTDRAGLPVTGTIRISVAQGVVKLEFKLPEMSELPATDIENLLSQSKTLAESLQNFKDKEKEKGRGKLDGADVDPLLQALRSFSEYSEQVLNIRRFEEQIADGTTVREDGKNRILSIYDQSNYVRIKIRIPSIQSK